MSRFGWRWWSIDPKGALTSVNGVIWEPHEPIKAECMAYTTGFGRAGNDKHKRYAILPDGRWKEVGKSVPLGKRRNGVEIVDETAPAYDCHCGFWAYHDPIGAYGLPHVSGYHKNTRVFGVIEAWGFIVDHELGFRAEYCIPRGVLVMRGRLHPTYFETLRKFRNFEELIAEYDVDAVEEEAE